MRHNTAIIVFSGFNQRAVIAFLRTLEGMGISYCIIAVSESDPIFLTDYCSKTLSIRKSSQLELNDLLNSLRDVKEKLAVDNLFIAPSTEALNRFILKHKPFFEEIGCTIPLVNEKLYIRISDKYSFGEICNNYKITVPKKYSHEAEFIYPLVAKPKKYFSQITGQSLFPVIINSSTEYSRFQNVFSSKEFYLQEYIKGKSFYLLYYIYKNGTIRKFSQQNLIQQPEGKSIVAAIPATLHLSELAKQYEYLLEKLKFRGLIMIEVKEYKDSFYMIEANPRFWGPSQLFIDSGINLYEDLLKDYNFINETSNKVNELLKSKYFWYGGIMETLSKNKKLIFHNYTLKDLVQELPEWMANDIYRRNDTRNIFKKELKLR